MLVRSIKDKQKIYDKRFETWQQQHPGVRAKRIDKVNDRDILGLKKYWLTEHGEVISCARRIPRQLKTESTKSGYSRVRLGSLGRFRVNRLMIETFKDESKMLKPLQCVPITCLEAHHINSDLKDNSIENLQAEPKDLHSFIHKTDFSKDLTAEASKKILDFSDLYTNGSLVILQGIEEDNPITWVGELDDLTSKK